MEEVLWLRRTTGEPPAGLLLGPAPDPLPKWVIGDTHWGHSRLVQLCGRPADHDWLMLRRWRETVGEGDGVLHVGDVSWCTPKWIEPIAALPGVVDLVPGNHDHRRDIRQYKGIGWRVVGPFAFTYGGWTVLVTHQPEPRLPGRTLNVHGHLHNNPSHSVTDRHINVSAEVVGYRPVPLLGLLDERLADLTAA